MKLPGSLFQFAHKSPFNSINVRLPLSYAAIAFLVALSLGVVLMGTLSEYYRQQETDYLRRNAQAISVSLGQILAVDKTPDDLQAQVNLFAFLSRTRVQVVDTEGQPLAQSEAQTAVVDFQQPGLRLFAGDIPDIVTVSSVTTLPDNVAITAGEGSATDEDRYMFNFWIASDQTGDTDYTSTLPQTELIYISREPGLYGFGLTQTDSTITVVDRSSEVVAQPILSQDGIALATAYLSDGPAYGSEILSSVASGWLLASVISITLAVFAGYIASRNVSAPVNHLIQATNLMAAGDLSIRTEMDRADEFGLLGQAFNDMAQQVESTVSALQHFVSDAAHEVNTPITALRTNLELIHSEVLIEQDRITLQRAFGQVKRLEDLTRNLLKLSRLESGIHAVKPAAFDVVTIMREVIESFASRADQANIYLEFKAQEAPCMCLGYAEHLRVAFENLIDNALKFTTPGGQVNITVYRQASMTIVTIQDTGIGIPDGHLASIFERFHRAPNASLFDGNGLGLAIVKEIVQKHQGTITARNSYPGTRITISLP